MSKMEKSENITQYIEPPRPLWIPFILFVSIFPLIVFMLLSFTLVDAGDTITILGLAAMFLVTFIILSLFIYLRKDEYSLSVSLADNLLEKTRKNKSVNKYELNSIKAFVSKYIKTFGDAHYQLLIQKQDSSLDILFEMEGLHFSPGNWHKFAKRLSEATKKELTIENWQDDYEGDLKLIPQEELPNTAKKLSMFIAYALTIFVSFAGALFFLRNPSVNSFLGFGAATVMLNAIIFKFLLSAFLHVKNKPEYDNLAIIAYVTLLIKYFVMYALIVFYIKLYSEFIN